MTMELSLLSVTYLIPPMSFSNMSGANKIIWDSNYLKFGKDNEVIATYWNVN
jgi:hypothetical protein